MHPLFSILLAPCRSSILRLQDPTEELPVTTQFALRFDSFVMELFLILPAHASNFVCSECELPQFVAFGAQIVPKPPYLKVVCEVC